MCLKSAPVRRQVEHRFPLFICQFVGLEIIFYFYDNFTWCWDVKYIFGEKLL